MVKAPMKSSEDRKREIMKEMYCPVFPSGCKLCYKRWSKKCSKRIDQALSQLNALYLKEIEENWPKHKTASGVYNQALDDTLKILREILGGGR